VTKLIIKTPEGLKPNDIGVMCKTMYRYNDGYEYWTETPNGDDYQICDDMTEIWVDGKLRDFGYVDAWGLERNIQRYKPDVIEQKFGITKENYKDYSCAGVTALVDGEYPAEQYLRFYQEYVGYNG